MSPFARLLAVAVLVAVPLVAQADEGYYPIKADDGETIANHRIPVEIESKIETLPGIVITGNEDGVKHCAQNVLYTLQHIGYTIPPQADAGWIGEAGPGPSYLDPGSGGPENDFTNRNTTFMTWNLMHLARLLKSAGGVPAHGNIRSGWDAGCRYDFVNPEYR